MTAVQEAGGDMTKINGDSIFPVLNMLNAKYFILPLQAGQTVPLQNPYVYGNGWFVDRLDYVDNANQELDRVGKLNLRHHAVADRKFEKQLGKAVAENETALVKLTAYEPNKLTYQVKSDKGGVVVFSEVYYPGWEATVDGNPVELGRVNYILRAINVQPGTHQVVLSFYPKSVDGTETIAYVAYAILLAMIGLSVYFETRKKKTV